MIASLLSSTLSTARQKADAISVISFNVLAPCWASPKYYPSAALPFLDKKLRRPLIIDLLKKMGDKADIIALQETTQTEFYYFKKALQKNYYAFQANHAPHYWSSWNSSTIPVEPNGVALFIKRTSFSHVYFKNLALTQDGNHSAYFEGVQKSTGKVVRAASIHLDSELSSNREKELNALLSVMRSRASNDFIIGDFNFGTQSGTLHQYLSQNNFKDVLHTLHKEEWTHPFNEKGDVNAGILDHIVVRNAKAIDGRVLNFGLWKLYPKDENQRIISNLQKTGSDHFPLYGVLKLI